MPASSQAVPMPVPVPISRKRPPGVDAASTRKRAPVVGSEAIAKPLRLLSRRKSASTSGAPSIV